MEKSIVNFEQLRGAELAFSARVALTLLQHSMDTILPKEGQTWPQRQLVLM